MSTLWGYTKIVIEGPFGRSLMYINEKTQRCAVLSCSGTQDVSVALWAPSNPLCPVALYPRKFSGRCAVFILCYGHQASFASLTAGHLHVCRFESRLSASVVSTPAPFGRSLMSINEKTQRCAVLSCSGTQD